jgi:hypothetical protein
VAPVQKLEYACSLAANLRGRGGGLVRRYRGAHNPTSRAVCAKPRANWA